MNRKIFNDREEVYRLSFKYWFTADGETETRLVEEIFEADFAYCMGQLLSTKNYTLTDVNITLIAVK